MSEALIIIAMVLLTVTTFFLMTRLYQRFPTPILIPILTSTAIIIAILLSLRLPYDTYMTGGKFIDYLLGPAVVALAIPLYKQRIMLMKNMVSLIGGVLVGSVAGILTGLWLAKGIGVEKMLVTSLVPKSVTTPVAMNIATEIGGNPSLTVAFVMIAGIGGTVLSPYLIKLFRIDHALGQGIALGSASHAIGTAKAFEYGEDAASVSSVAMTLCAITVSILAPLFMMAFYA